MLQSDSPDEIRDILNSVRTIAVVGASQDPSRPSHYVMEYLKNRGYRTIPVNPGLAGQKVLGETVHASLKDIPEPVDMVDVFRRSEQVPPVVDEAIETGAKVVWMQVGIRHPEAAARARAAGLKVVMNRCTITDCVRLGARPTAGDA